MGTADYNYIDLNLIDLLFLLYETQEMRISND